ncbi:MAG TPA: hypothetical protein VKR06_31700 [Ktedonosporobacter sp.]|nr:hypothetical protein [Ktedonosporobacter sp.]
MIRQYPSCNTDVAESEQIWFQLYSTLRPSIAAWVYASDVAVWHGQENDIVEDILQETAIRIHKYMQQVEKGVNPPILSMRGFSKAVAHNHFQDLRRKDARLLHFPRYEGRDTATLIIMRNDDVDPAEIAHEALTRLSLLMTAVHIIVSLPQKQRTALLIDLANLSQEDEKYEPLQTAFLHVGIRLHDYRQALPTNTLERGRHAALLSIAYKAVRQKFRSRESEW